MSSSAPQDTTTALDDTDTLDSTVNDDNDHDDGGDDDNNDDEADTSTPPSVTPATGASKRQQRKAEHQQKLQERRTAKQAKAAQKRDRKTKQVLSAVGSSSSSSRTPSAAAIAEMAAGESVYPLIDKLDRNRYVIRRGFVPNMLTEGVFFADEQLAALMLEEIVHRDDGSGGGGGFMPAVQQIANVASLPGIVGYSMGMPDAHSGYGFSIGGVAAIDMDDEHGVVSPGGVGFDINCGVRLIRTNLSEEDVRPVQEQLAQELFDSIPGA